jgi:hypothetical protein
MGFTTLKPGKGAVVGRSASVRVSPTLASCTSLTLAATAPTSPAMRESTGRDQGEKTASSCTSYSLRVDQSMTFWRGRSVPSKTRRSITTPR